MKKKQNIKCDKECNLEEIKVSSNCDCPKDEVCDQEQTVCASFEKNEEEN